MPPRIHTMSRDGASCERPATLVTRGSWHGRCEGHRS
jgi:hypothetical protein